MHKKYKYYKNLGIGFYLFSITVLLLNRFSVGIFEHDFFSGLATGILVVALGLTIFFAIKSRDPNFMDDLEASATDERVIAESYKIKAQAGTFLLFFIVIALTISVFYEFDFSIGATIILWSYLIVLGVLRLIKMLRR